ncbi:hypothetical protein CsSME_00020477 [Camellia sinensis var. sinensis]
MEIKHKFRGTIIRTINKTQEICSTEVVAVLELEFTLEEVCEAVKECDGNKAPGLPLGANPRRKKAWQPMVDKVKSRLAMWKIKLLSFAGRLTLVKSVLDSIPGYYISLCKLPIGIAKEIDKLKSTFLWGSSELRRKIHMVKWNDVSMNKDQGGPDTGKQAGGDTFVAGGFATWNKKERLRIHVGGLNSAHNQAVKKCEVLMKQKQHIESAFSKQSEQAKIEYRTRLNASIDCIRFLLRQGLAFRGHDESNDSSSKGNFLELLQFLVDHNESINEVVLKNTPKNNKLCHPNIQKDIANAAASETTNAIILDLGNEYFSILVDESRDVSIKEQMAVVLHYVDERGIVTEWFLGIVHVADTTALSLKVAIESLFSRHGLSLARIRGQGYDGASNMQGAFNGLKTLILRENKSTYYVHCFAHQLQLTLIAVAKNHIDVAEVFCLVSNLVNVVGGSCKRRDILREAQATKVAEALNNGELLSGQEDGLHAERIVEARSLMDSMQSFEFVFTLHLMKNIFGITHELSLALQRKDQDIVNAMTLVKVSKQRLQMMRDDEWESILEEVYLFCGEHDIPIPNIDDRFVACGRLRRKAPKITNLYHYRVEIFYTVIDMQLQELNNRFTEASTELLLCVACLNPNNSFYLMALDNQLQNYIVDMRSSNEFSELKGIGDLTRKLVETKKDIVYPLVCLLVKLALILPVATATVERAFSAMKFIKNRLRNRMADQWLNDCLVTYIEKDIFDSVDNELIMQRFQNMKSRHGQL